MRFKLLKICEEFLGVHFYLSNNLLFYLLGRSLQSISVSDTLTKEEPIQFHTYLV